jgi:hypothetical protein
MGGFGLEPLHLRVELGEVGFDGRFARRAGILRVGRDLRS